MNGFDKVIGYDAIKLEIARICDVIKNSDKYQKLGVKIPKGLLLYGEPGVGKTLIANTFVEECGKNANLYEKENSIFADITANETSLIYWCLQYGENIELLSPKNTRDKIKKILKRMTNMYE